MADVIVHVGEAEEVPVVIGGQTYIKGDKGNTFFPSVSENGDISWSNDGGLPNPPTVNIKGPQGEPGNYTKPSSGIPKSDLASDVQASLDKADTALQEHQSLADYRTAAAQDLIDAGKLGTSGDGSNVTAAFTAASTRDNITTGEKLSVIFGKIAKWFADLGTAAFKNFTSSITQGSADLITSGAVHTGLAGKAASDLGITGASVGDLVRISAVSSGKPTAFKKVPLNEIKCNPNLLDNWYFVGGGSQQGYGVFPINQRGQTSYSGSYVYAIDRWIKRGSATLTVGANGLSLGSVGSDENNGLYQAIESKSALQGKTVTLSAYITEATFASGQKGSLRLVNATTVGNAATSLFDTKFDSAGLVTVTGTIPSTLSNPYLCAALYYENANCSFSVVAMKLELGSEQTLAHQENGEWVLNEVPDYETELLHCKTSTASPDDTYANGSVEFGNNIGIVQNGNTATQNISEGQYVIWKGALYTASAAIASGATLSSSNLTAVTGGGLNSVDFRMLRRLYSNDDLDNIRGTGATGLYYIGANVPNSPANYAMMLVISREGDNGYAIQLVLSEGAYLRQYVGNTPHWTSWKRLDNV